MKLLFIDVETTGLDPAKHGIIQIAGIVEIDGEVKEKFNLFCGLFEGQIISQQALTVNARTVEEIRQFPPPRQTYTELLAILDRHVDRYAKADKFYMVGQNVTFDHKFLDAWFKRNGNEYLYAYIHYDRIDLVALTAAFKVAGIIKPDNVRLETVAKCFGITYKAHDAEADIATTREIFYRYVGEIRNPTLPILQPAPQPAPEPAKPE